MLCMPIKNLGTDSCKRHVEGCNAPLGAGDRTEGKQNGKIQERE